MNDVRTYLATVKGLLTGSKMWYVVALKDGEVAGSGYNFRIKGPYKPKLGHSLLVKETSG